MADFEEVLKNDKRTFLPMFLSLIKNNSTLLFIFLCNENDIFSKVSLAIISLNLYIFINILLMYDSSALHLYKDRDFYLKEKLEGKYLVINIIIPFFLYIPTCIIKKLTSRKEFMIDRSYEKEIIMQEYKGGKKILEKHDLKTKVSKFINHMREWTDLLFKIGLVILIINLYVVTCFCGIYSNSFDCLFLNTFMSLIFSLILTLVIFAVSAGLRLYSIRNNSDTAFCFSLALNPLYHMYKRQILKKKILDKEKIN